MGFNFMWSLFLKENVIANCKYERIQIEIKTLTTWEVLIVLYNVQHVKVVS